MLPQPVKENFDKLMGPQLAKRDDRLGQEIAQRISTFVQHGTSASSMCMFAVAQTAGNEAAVRVALAFGELQRCLEAYGFALDRQAANDLLHELQLFANVQFTRLRQRAASSGAFTQGLPGADSILRQVDEIGSRALGQVAGELDLLVARAQTQRAAPAPAASGTNVTITGPVGAIHTGQGDITIASQQFDQSTRVEVVRVLQQLDKELEAVPDAALPVPKAELREMVALSVGEAQQEKPNRTKLKAMLEGIANTISTVATLQGAYENVKGILSLIGITLP